MTWTGAKRAASMLTNTANTGCCTSYEILFPFVAKEIRRLGL